MGQRLAWQRTRREKEDANAAYKKPTRVESVEIEADAKAGQVVEPSREMHVSDMASGLNANDESAVPTRTLI